MRQIQSRYRLDEGNSGEYTNPQTVLSHSEESSYTQAFVDHSLANTIRGHRRAQRQRGLDVIIATTSKPGSGHSSPVLITRIFSPFPQQTQNQALITP